MKRGIMKIDCVLCRFWGAVLCLIVFGVFLLCCFLLYCVVIFYAIIFAVFMLSRVVLCCIMLLCLVFWFIVILYRVVLCCVLVCCFVLCYNAPWYHVLCIPCLKNTLAENMQVAFNFYSSGGDLEIFLPSVTPFFRPSARLSFLCRNY